VLDHDGNGVLEEEDFTLIGDGISDQIGYAKNARERLSLKVKAYSLFLQILEDIGKSKAELTPDEWLRFYEEFVLVKSNEYIRQASNYLFLLFDQDGDGYIDEAEYVAMFRAYGLYTANAKMAFDKLDLNSDGRISDEELIKAFSDFFLSSDPDAAGNWIFGDWKRDVV
jgi:Ca2+-binding EF-hand superfamily protein